MYPVDKGTHKERPHKDYSYRRTEVDEHGNTKHIYAVFHTDYVDEDLSRIAERERGQQNEKQIPGYEYIRSIPEPEKALITHVYRQVITSWQDEGGKTLKPNDKGIQPHGDIAGYVYVRTETKPNGDNVHIFKKAGKEATNDFGVLGLVATSVLSAFGIKKLKKVDINSSK